MSEAIIQAAPNKQPKSAPPASLAPGIKKGSSLALTYANARLDPFVHVRASRSGHPRFL